MSNHLDLLGVENSDTNLRLRRLEGHAIRQEQEHWPRNRADVQHSLDCAEIVGQFKEMRESLLAAVKRLEIEHEEGCTILSGWINDAKTIIDKTN